MTRRAEPGAVRAGPPAVAARPAGGELVALVKARTT